MTSSLPCHHWGAIAALIGLGAIPKIRLVNFPGSRLKTIQWTPSSAVFPGKTNTAFPKKPGLVNFRPLPWRSQLNWTGPIVKSSKLTKLSKTAKSQQLRANKCEMTTSAEFCRDRSMQQLRCDESEAPLIFFYMLFGDSLLSLYGLETLSFWALFPSFPSIVRFVWGENPVLFRCFALHLAKMKKGKEEKVWVPVPA